MGYYIYITRSEYPEGDDGMPITLEEWLAYVEQDPELTLEEDVDYEVAWDGADGKCGDLLYSAGCRLRCKYNEQIIDKMVQIAKDLGARVIGDDDEIYMGDGIVMRRKRDALTE